MSLVLSLTAALVATIVQHQWHRDYYTHVFRRPGHPLKGSRVQQSLYEGATKWYSGTSVVVDAVPAALIQNSLLWFFIGLAADLFNINTATGITIAIVIVVIVIYASLVRTGQRSGGDVTRGKASKWQRRTR